MLAVRGEFWLNLKLCRDCDKVFLLCNRLTINYQLSRLGKKIRRNSCLG